MQERGCKDVGANKFFCFVGLNWFRTIININVKKLFK